jgi:hypothetical protein
MYKAKSSNLVLALLLVLSALFNTSCNKYESGPFFSFRSAKNRIANTWYVQSYSINGKEMAGLPEYSTQKQFWLSGGIYNATYINPLNQVGERADGTWELLDNNKKVNLTITNQVTGLPSSVTTYNILQLRNNTFWLRSQDNSVEIHLVTSKE